MRSKQRDGGFALVELLVVLVILGVVGGVVTSATVTALRSATVTNARVAALSELEIALQRVTRDLRAADPIELHSDDYAMGLGASIDRSGTRSSVLYKVIESEGHQRLVREATGQTLISDLDNGGEPVFRYLDQFGQEIACTTDCDAAYMHAAQIEVRLVRAIEGREPVTAETRVSVRNLRHGST